MGTNKKIVKQTLYSVDPKKYADIEVEFEEFSSPVEILEKATEGPVIYAKKTVPVKARYAKIGEVVDTRPRVIYDGKTYTFSEVTRVVESETNKDGSRMVIITNPDGEEYLQPETKTRAKYEVGELSYEPTCAIPKGNVVGFKKINTNAYVNVWGDPWFVTEGGYVSADKEDCYPITNAAFEKTYAPIQEHSKDK